MENSTKDYDILPRLFTDNLKQKMLLGILPSETTEKLFYPLLKDFQNIYPKLSSGLQKEITSILYIYPEIAEDYQICLIPENQKSFGFDSILEFFQSYYKKFINILNDYSFHYKRYYKYATVPVLITSILLFIPFYNNVIRQSVPIRSDFEKNYPVYTQIIERLVPIVEINSLSNQDISFKKLKAYYLSETNSHAFYIGFHIALINLSIMGNNNEKALEYFNNSYNSIKILNLKLNNQLKTFESKLKNSKLNKTDVDELSKNIHSFLKKIDLGYVYQFGEWCAIAYASVLSENSQAIKECFKQTENIKNIFDRIKATLPELVIKKFNNIEIIATLYNNDETKLYILKKEFNNFIKIMNNNIKN